ncbi:RRM domain-containing protein [Plasmodiophora brassicae]|uniref:RRM domain-containing protein n=1 Tax=Plasmodiophora brassicae TaxID=37360 RepID=A0A3P3YIZ9_PLABS|nr:unnamed protein product [Plasmodiophora brassicae]
MDHDVASMDSNEIISEVKDIGLQDSNETAIDNDDEKPWEEFEKRTRKSGVVYLSRIPPFMSVHLLRRMMSQFGEVGRIYLTPEDAATARRRKKFKGSTRKNYVDGWIEFAKKRIAKQVAESLNNTQIGGKKRSKFHDDIWNIRYLKGFKWHHLTEKLSYENAVRAQKHRNELSAAKKEYDFIMEKHQQAKVVENIQKRRKRRREASGQAGEASELPSHHRHFRQRQPVQPTTE